MTGRHRPPAVRLLRMKDAALKNDRLWARYIELCEEEDVSQRWMSRVSGYNMTRIMDAYSGKHPTHIQMLEDLLDVLGREIVAHSDYRVTPHRRAEFICKAHWLGELLRETRQAIGMSSRDVAEAIGVSPSGLRKWETGDSLPVVTPIRLALAEVGIRLGIQKKGDTCPIGPRVSSAASLAWAKPRSIVRLPLAA